MSGRDSKPKKPAPRLPTFIGRTQAMSSGGPGSWEATSIGFTLVSCIVACAGLGYWLDSHFKTSFWLPVLFLVGVIGGFREMFVILGRISKEQEAKKQQQRESVRPAPIPPREEDEVALEPQSRERIFKVPPPPVPGSTPVADGKVDAESDEPESVDALIERLLQDEKSDDEK
jgi:F0F1-type ATP synthase assembly protein I